MRPSPCLTRSESNPSRLDAQLRAAQVPEHISRIVARFLAVRAACATQDDNGLTVVAMLACPKCGRTAALVRDIGQPLDVVCTAPQCSGRCLMAQHHILGLQWASPADAGAVASPHETAAEHIRNAMQMLPALASSCDPGLFQAVNDRLTKALQECER